MKKLVLIDSNALVHRAFHALPPLTSPSGAPTNAVYGFVSVLLKMITDLKPDYIAATFDLPGPTFRHEEYEEYKAHRQKAPDELYAQIPAVKDMLGAFGIPVYAQAGYEADDVIGSIAQYTGTVPDLQTVIVTGDLDTLQLIQGEKVVVFTMRKGMSDTVIYDEKAVMERMGLAPNQVTDYKGLKGDPSDNIPGVPGIGEKTASALIQTFGTLEKLYEAVEKGETAKPLTEKLIAKLIEHKDMALFSKKLATIIRTVNVDFALERSQWRTHVNEQAIEDLCRTLGFSTLTKRIQTTLGIAAKAAVTQTLDLDGGTPVSEDPVTQVSGADALPSSDMIAIHADSENGELTSLMVTTDGERVFSVSAPTVQILADIMGRYSTLVMHDLKPALKLLPNIQALTQKTYGDTTIAAWLCEPDQRDYSLERIYQDMVGQPLPQGRSQRPLAIWRLHSLLWDTMKSSDILSVFTDIEMPLVPILAIMERTGIRVNTDKIGTLLTTVTASVQRLEQAITKLAGVDFNINSPSQLGDVLFNTLAIRGKVRKTGGGAPSTAASELEKLRQEHPIIDLVLEYRELNKLKTTYIEPFPTLVAADGRLHTTYHQNGAATGRLSSSDPNLQNIPARTEVGQEFRSVFVADPDSLLVSLDYSQLELRIVAHLAQDKTMIEAFERGEDIHTRTASEIFGLAQDKVTKDMRRQAKVLNFGIIYGMGVLGFARAAGVSRDTAKKFIDEYFARFAGVARYMEATKQQAFEQGFVSTLFGRRRKLPDIASRIPQLAAQAERMAINHPVQGTAADLVKLAMISIDRHVRENSLERDARMLLQVHDELVFEVPQDKALQVGQTMKKIMQDIHRLDVPLVVDVKIGPTWADMKTIT